MNLEWQMATSGSRHPVNQAAYGLHSLEKSNSQRMYGFFWTILGEEPNSHTRAQT